MSESFNSVTKRLLKSRAFGDARLNLHARVRLDELLPSIAEGLDRIDAIELDEPRCIAVVGVLVKEKRLFGKKMMSAIRVRAALLLEPSFSLTPHHKTKIGTISGDVGPWLRILRLFLDSPISKDGVIVDGNDLIVDGSNMLQRTLGDSDPGDGLRVDISDINVDSRGYLNIRIMARGER